MLAATAASAEVGLESVPVAPGERVKARGAGRNWEDGRTGPLHTGDIFDVSLVRDESEMFVCRDYNVRGNEADDAFNSFICLRNLFYEQHPDLDPPTDHKEEVTRDDVERLATFICEPAGVQTQVSFFMSRFDPNGRGRITRQMFQTVLQAECDKIRLSRGEAFFFLFEEPTSSIMSLRTAMIVMLLILISSIGFILSSEPSMQKPNPDPTLPPVEKEFFAYMETVCILCFTVEYLSRALTVWQVRSHLAVAVIKVVLIEPRVKDHDTYLTELSNKGPGPLRRTINYLTTTMNLIDFVAIVPFYIDLAMKGSGGQLAVLRILRLARVFRIFKVGKYNDGINLLANVMLQSLPALNLLAFFAGIGIILFGSMIYFAESGVWHAPSTEFPNGVFLRDDVYGNSNAEETPFSSIPRSFWWVVVTATTVGYGDLVPTTPAGKIVATITMISGLLVLALPITIIGANFAQEYQIVEEKKKRAKERAAVEEADEHDAQEETASGIGPPSIELTGSALHDGAADGGAEMNVDGSGAGGSGGGGGGGGGGSDATDAGADAHSEIAAGEAFPNARRTAAFMFNARAATADAMVNIEAQKSAEAGGGVPPPPGSSPPSAYRGQLAKGLMKHSAMIDSGQRCLDLVQMLMVDEKINKTVAANIAREVQDIMVKVVSKKCRGSDVDSAIHTVLNWINRAINSDPEDIAKLDSDSERLLRHGFLSFTIAAVASNAHVGREED